MERSRHRRVVQHDGEEIAALIAAAFPRRAKFHDGAVAFLND
jgi:hypothetical protein